MGAWIQGIVLFFFADFTAKHCYLLFLDVQENSYCWFSPGLVGGRGHWEFYFLLEKRLMEMTRLPSLFIVNKVLVNLPDSLE